MHANEGVPGPSPRHIIVVLVPDLPSWPTLIPKVIWGNWTIWSIPACPRANLASKRLFVTECQVCIMSIIPTVIVPLIAQCPLVGVVHSASFCPHHAASPALCGVHLKKKQNSWDWRSTAICCMFFPICLENKFKRKFFKHNALF